MEPTGRRHWRRRVEEERAGGWRREGCGVRRGRRVEEATRVWEKAAARVLTHEWIRCAWHLRKLVMAHRVWCAITSETSNGALYHGAPLISLWTGGVPRRNLAVAHHTSGAPLVIWTLMAHLIMVRHYYIAVAHHIYGAPLMSILAIAVFLVVLGTEGVASCESSLTNSAT